MDILECIKNRRSVRSFTDKPIPWETIQAIAQSAAYVPSWRNTQTVRYTITDDREMINKIADNGVFGFAKNMSSIKGCAALAVQSVVKGICGYNPDGSFSSPKGDSWEMYDAGISVQTICLAAYSYGIGSLIMGLYDEPAISEMISLPDNERITALIAFGYPAGENKMPPKNGLDVLLRKI